MTTALATVAEPQWPADEVYRVRVSQLVPYANNAKQHSDEQVGLIAASIKEWGWTIPVLVDEHGVLIAGHGRVLAAKRLGLQTIPCMKAVGWSDAQKNAYRLADNVLTERGTYDDDLLKIEIRGIEALNFDIGKIGFDMERLTKLFDDPPAREEAPRESRGLGEAVIQFNIVFEDASQQDAWFLLVRKIKERYPNMETLGERIKAFVEEEFSGD